MASGDVYTYGMFYPRGVITRFQHMHAYLIYFSVYTPPHTHTYMYINISLYMYNINSGLTGKELFSTYTSRIMCLGYAKYMFDFF